MDTHDVFYVKRIASVCYRSFSKVILASGIGRALEQNIVRSAIPQGNRNPCPQPSRRNQTCHSSDSRAAHGKPQLNEITPSAELSANRPALLAASKTEECGGGTTRPWSPWKPEPSFR